MAWPLSVMEMRPECGSLTTIVELRVVFTVGYKHWGVVAASRWRVLGSGEEGGGIEE